MSFRKVFKPIIMSSKPDGTVEYKPIATSDDADQSIMNIFLPREDNAQLSAQGNGVQSLNLGTIRA